MSRNPQKRSAPAWFPVAFGVSILEDRKRKPTQIVVREEVAVDVAEVDREDAPTALRVGDVEYRRHEGRLFVARYDGDGLRELSERALSLVRSQRRGDIVNYPFRGWKGETLRDPFGFVEDPTGRRVISSDRDAAMAQVLRIAADMISIDGILWVERPEPALRLDTVNFAVKLIVGGAYPASNSAMFRLDRLEAAEEAMAKLSALTRRSGSSDVAPLEILIPECLAFDEARYMAQTLRHSIPNCRGEGFRRLPSAAVGAWLAMREAAEEPVSPGADARVIDAGLDLARRLVSLEAVESFRRETFGHHMLQEVLPALTCWSTQGWQADAMPSMDEEALASGFG